MIFSPYFQRNNFSNSSRIFYFMFDKVSRAMSVSSGEVAVSCINEGIPVYDIDVAAGCTEMTRAFTEENVIGRLNFPNLNPEWIVVRAKGDSMMPKINNGGYVAFLPQSDLASSSSSLKSVSSTILNAVGRLRKFFPLAVMRTSPKFSTSRSMYPAMVACRITVLR